MGGPSPVITAQSNDKHGRRNGGIGARAVCRIIGGIQRGVVGSSSQAVLVVLENVEFAARSC